MEYLITLQEKVKHDLLLMNRNKCIMMYKIMHIKPSIVLL